MITLIATPQYIIQVTPAIITRWLATECPSIFQFKREDLAIASFESAGSPGILSLTFATPFPGNVADQIAVYDSYYQTTRIGTVISKASPATTINTDIPWVTGMVPTFINNNTLKGGYYVEGRLTMTGVLQTITAKAYPNTLGIANLDVSGILQISIVTGKSGDYTDLVMKEPLKSGSFTLEYRECWYGSDEAWTQEGNTWNYAEGVRSEEQGSNLHEYVATTITDARFFNSFERPVYFQNLPWDISFFNPIDPATNTIRVTKKKYNPANTLLATEEETISKTGLEGFMNSLRIAPGSIEAGVSKMTIQIETYNV